MEQEKGSSVKGRGEEKEIPWSLSLALIFSHSSLWQYIKLRAHSQWKDWTCGIPNLVEQWRLPWLEYKCLYCLWYVKDQDKKFTAKRQFSYKSGPNIRMWSLVFVLQFLMWMSDVWADSAIVLLSPDCRNPMRIMIIGIPQWIFIRSISLIYFLYGPVQEGKVIICNSPGHGSE